MLTNWIINSKKKMRQNKRKISFALTSLMKFIKQKTMGIYKLTERLEQSIVFIIQAC